MNSLRHTDYIYFKSWRMNENSKYCHKSKNIENDSNNNVIHYITQLN